jgi:hypothetical protein
MCNRSAAQGPCQGHGVAWSSQAPHDIRTPCAGLRSRFGTPRLADLHPVPALTARHWAPPPPPSSRPHPGIGVSSPRRDTRWGRAPVLAQQTRATRSGRLDAGCLGDNASHRAALIRPAPAHCGSGVSQPFSPRPRHDASDRGALRPHRSQDSSRPPRMARRRGPFLRRLRTPGGAPPCRPRHSPHTVVHVWCSERTICCTVKGRTPTPAVSRA